MSARGLGLPPSLHHLLSPSQAVSPPGQGGWGESQPGQEQSLPVVSSDHRATQVCLGGSGAGDGPLGPVRVQPCVLAMAGWCPARVCGNSGGARRLRNLGAAPPALLTPQRSRPLLGQLGSDSGKPSEEGLPSTPGPGVASWRSRVPLPPTRGRAVAAGAVRTPRGSLRPGRAGQAVRL